MVDTGSQKSLNKGLLTAACIFNLKWIQLSGSVFPGDEWKTAPNRWTACVQGPQSQSVLPLGREIVQRWTAVPRAGHIGSEITHSIYGSLRVWGLTDLSIQQQTGRQLAAQSFSQGQPPCRLQDDFILFCSDRTALLIFHAGYLSMFSIYLYYTMCCFGAFNRIDHALKWTFKSSRIRVTVSQLQMLFNVLWRAIKH